MVIICRIARVLLLYIVIWYLSNIFSEKVRQTWYLNFRSLKAYKMWHEFRISCIFIGISTRAIYLKQYEALINKVSMLFSTLSFNSHGLKQILLKCGCPIKPSFNNLLNITKDQLFTKHGYVELISNLTYC